MKINLKNILLSTLVCATLVGCNSEELASSSAPAEGGSVAALTSSNLVGKWISGNLLNDPVELRMTRSEKSEDEFSVLPNCEISDQDAFGSGLYEMSMFITIDEVYFSDRYMVLKNIEDQSRCLFEKESEQLDVNLENGHISGPNEDPNDSYAIASMPDANTLVVRFNELNGHWRVRWSMNDQNELVYNFVMIDSFESHPVCNSEEAGFQIDWSQGSNYDFYLEFSFIIFDQYKAHYVIIEKSSGKSCSDEGEIRGEYSYDQFAKVLDLDHVEQYELKWNNDQNFDLVLPLN